MHEIMNENEKQKILSRIRKMLALADNAGASQGERENALRMAHATLAHYNFDIAEAERTGHTTADSGRTIVKGYFYGRPWARTAANAIADLLFCYYIFTPAKRATNVAHWFIGRESNATTAAELAEFVVKNIWSESHKRARAAFEGNEYARNFATGAAYSIKTRCAELRKTSTEVTTAEPGTALVLAGFYDRELSANQEHLKAEGVETEDLADRRKETKLQDAIRKGLDYGTKINLDRQITGKTVPRIK